MAGIIIMILGAILFLIGLFIFSSYSRENKQPAMNPKVDNVAVEPLPESVLSKSDKDSNRIIPPPKKQNIAPINIDNENKADPRSADAETEKLERDKKNGDDFEKFIVQKFDKKYFKIKEWAGDKYVNGLYAETTQNPDILFEFKLKDEIRLFSVECKWRKKLFKNGVEFASDSQLARYRKFESERSIPVFVAIGISGEASHPDHLYMIPLKNIMSTFLTIEELKSFEKKDDRNFFYHMKTNAIN